MMKATGSSKSSILLTVFLIVPSIIPCCESMKEEDPAYVATWKYKDNIKLFQLTVVAGFEADENYL